MEKQVNILEALSRRYYDDLYYILSFDTKEGREAAFDALSPGGAIILKDMLGEEFNIVMSCCDTGDF